MTIENSGISVRIICAVSVLGTSDSALGGSVSWTGSSVSVAVKVGVGSMGLGVMVLDARGSLSEARVKVAATMVFNSALSKLGSELPVPGTLHAMETIPHRIMNKRINLYLIKIRMIAEEVVQFYQSIQDNLHRFHHYLPSDAGAHMTYGKVIFNEETYICRKGAYNSTRSTPVSFRYSGY